MKESETFVGDLDIWFHDFIIAEDENCFRYRHPRRVLQRGARRQKRVAQDRRWPRRHALSGARHLGCHNPDRPLPSCLPDGQHPSETSVELLGDIRRVSNLLEAVKANHNGDFAAAVEEVLGWDAAMLRTQLTQLSQGLSKKPTMALFSQADRCFGVSPARDPKGVGMDVPEHDPLLCAARNSPPWSISSIVASRISGSTSLPPPRGQPQDSKDFHVGTPSIGVWPPIEWLRQRVALRQAAEPERGRFSRLWNRMLKTDRLRDDERTSGWAIDLRIEGGQGIQVGAAALKGIGGKLGELTGGGCRQRRCARGGGRFDRLEPSLAHMAPVRRHSGLPAARRGVAALVAGAGAAAGGPRR